MTQASATAPPVANGQAAAATPAWLTPDFYRYEWHALAHAHATSQQNIQVAWPDGTRLDCHVAWLRENAPGHGGIDPDSRECELDPALIPDDLAVASCAVVDGGLEVTFAPEGRHAAYHPGWLRHIADGRHLAASYLPTPEPWTTGQFTEPITYSYADVAADPDVRTDALMDLARYGLVRLRGCGTDPDFVGGFADTIGPTLGNVFGRIFKVEMLLTPDSLANTGLRLPPHTDFPGWETPPGLQFLHCVTNTVEGGHSTMTDGLALAHHLRQHHPEEFESLITDKWVFYNRSADVDVRLEAPIISGIDRDGVVGPWGVLYRGFHPVRGFPAMEPDRVAGAYRAVKVFSQVAACKGLMIRYPFTPGDMVIFDNRRVLHGREAFSPQAGTKRLLRGSYVNLDLFHSHLRVLAREREARALQLAPSPVNNMAGTNQQGS